MTPAVREVLRTVEILDRWQPFLQHGVAKPLRGVRVDRPNRDVLGHTLDEPERQGFDALPGPWAQQVADVVLKGVHQFVADDVVRVGERAGQRQHDSPPQRLGDATSPLAQLAFYGVGLLEVGVGGVQDQGLASTERMLEDLLEPGVPALGHARRDLDALALAGIEVDVEVIRFQDLKIEILVLDLVSTEVLGRCHRWYGAQHQPEYQGLRQTAGGEAPAKYR